MDMEKWIEMSQKMFEERQKRFDECRAMFEENRKSFEEYRESCRESVEDLFKEMPKFPMMPMMPPMPSMFAEWFMKEAGKEGSKVMGIPKDVLQKLLKIDASPKDLEKLQKLLDFVFDMYEMKC